MSDRIEIYRTAVRRKWRWRYVAANGNILADSGQGYSRRIDAINGAMTVTGSWPHAITERGAEVVWVRKLIRLGSKGEPVTLPVVKVAK